MSVSAQCETGTLSHVFLSHPRDAFGTEDRIAAQWRGLNYRRRPELAAAVREYDAFVCHLEEAGAQIDFFAADADATLDALYVRDASVSTDDGVILCRMGKTQRANEPVTQARGYAEQGIAVRGEIVAPGTLEGGDVIWLDERTVAVGQGYRSNAAGIAQLGALLGAAVDVVSVPLPHWQGEASVLHLMSLISPVDRDLALVYSPLLPVPFRQRLLARGVRLVEVPAEEMESLGCNVLAVGPRRCLMVSGNPVTRRRLEAAGAEVMEFDASNICLPGEGGPTCLTRPLARVRPSTPASQS